MFDHDADLKEQQAKWHLQGSKDIETINLEY